MPNDGNKWAIKHFKNCMAKNPKTEVECYLKDMKPCDKQKEN